MIPGPEAQRIKAQLMIWWIIWGGVLAGLCLLYFFFGRAKPLPVASTAELLTNLGGFPLLFISVIIRWLVLPRCSDPGRALVMFIIGLALAESCGILGIFLGGAYRDALFLLGVFGVIQYVPVFARKFFEPRYSGYIPNN
ncbi:MAG TPA: hypothetical protein VGM64_16360 [Lacunisphaera sp.]|jgi:hypothetical protein